MTASCSPSPGCRQTSAQSWRIRAAHASLPPRCSERVALRPQAFQGWQAVPPGTGPAAAWVSGLLLVLRGSGKHPPAVAPHDWAPVMAPPTSTHQTYMGNIAPPVDYRHLRMHVADSGNPRRWQQRTIRALEAVSGMEGSFGSTSML